MGNFDFETGCRYLEEGDVVEAIRCFLASLDVDRSHVQTYVELFRAYEAAWHDSGDPEVLDQMRKVALAGLRREPSDEQRRFLDEGLDRAEACIIHLQEEEHHAPAPGRRRLPLLNDDIEES